MEQLKMYWFPGTEIKEEALPQGYSISNYKEESDKLHWCECCKNGLVSDDADEETFYNRIEKCEDINPYEDVFFLDYMGEHIGTVTAFVHKATGTGDMHMVGIRTDFRGKKLSKYLSMVCLNHLKDKGIKYISLTTDDWRKGAVKGYLNAGFLPVEYDEGMEERWRALLREFNISSVKMVNEDGTFYKTINA